MPPGLPYVVVAALGALALGVGAVATIDGNLWGIPLAVGGAALLYWSVKVTKRQNEGLIAGASNAPPWQPGRRSGRCGHARPHA